MASREEGDLMAIDDSTLDALVTAAENLGKDYALGNDATNTDTILGVLEAGDADGLENDHGDPIEWDDTRPQDRDDIIAAYGRGLQKEQARAEEAARMEAAGRLDCRGCAETYADPWRIAPPHRASRYCESGGRPHCTCDRCF
jgi:ribosomal protein S12 methylthiotransferase accessory factor YcaO